jgi:hypothetical protein
VTIGMRHNEIVEAVRLAVQSYAAGENSYRSSVVTVLDGLAAYLLGVMLLSEFAAVASRERCRVLQMGTGRRMFAA